MKNIYDRPLTLAASLDAAADAIDSGSVKYSWNKRETCNCGILARTVLGISASQLAHGLNAHLTGTWTDIVDQTCPITGLSCNTIIRSLQEAGMERNDFTAVEYLHWKSVLHRAGLFRKRGIIGFRKIVEERDYERGSHAAAYMRAWASLIREYRAANPNPDDVTPGEMQAVEDAIAKVS